MAMVNVQLQAGIAVRCTRPLRAVLAGAVLIGTLALAGKARADEHQVRIETTRKSSACDVRISDPLASDPELVQKITIVVCDQERRGNVRQRYRSPRTVAFERGIHLISDPTLVGEAFRVLELYIKQDNRR